MASTTYAGPLRVGNKDGGLATLSGAATIAIAVTATANTDLSVKLPKCRILRAAVLTTTAFTGATVTAALGTTAGGAQLAAAADIKPAGYNPLTLTAAAAAEVAAETTLYLRVAQTTPTAVGAALLVVEVLPVA